MGEVIAIKRFLVNEQNEKGRTKRNRRECLFCLTSTALKVISKTKLWCAINLMIVMNVRHEHVAFLSLGQQKIRRIISIFFSFRLRDDLLSLCDVVGAWFAYIGIIRLVLLWFKLHVLVLLHGFCCGYGTVCDTISSFWLYSLFQRYCPTRHWVWHCLAIAIF